MVLTADTRMLSWYAHTTKTTMVPRSPRGATGWVDPNEEPELISQLEGIVRKLDVLEQERKGIPCAAIQLLFVCER